MATFDNETFKIAVCPKCNSYVKVVHSNGLTESDEIQFDKLRQDGFDIILEKIGFVRDRTISVFPCCLTHDILISLIGKNMVTFDDGKIKPSRKRDVLIEAVINFNDAPQELVDMWCIEKDELPTLYAPTTDYFIQGRIKYSETDYDIVHYVRTINFGWFTIEEFGGRLDIDGKLNEKLEDYIKKGWV